MAFSQETHPTFRFAWRRWGGSMLACALVIGLAVSAIGTPAPAHAVGDADPVTTAPITEALDAPVDGAIPDDAVPADPTPSTAAAPAVEFAAPGVSVSPANIELGDAVVTVAVQISFAPGDPAADHEPFSELRNGTAVKPVTGWQRSTGETGELTWAASVAFDGSDRIGVWTLTGPDPLLTGTLMAVPEVLRATAAPTVSGAFAVGSTLQATSGTWAPSVPQAPNVALQWLRGGEAIPNATAATYTLTPADAQAKISVRATATRAIPGVDIPVTAVSVSAERAVGVGQTQAGQVAISGTPQMGQDLTAKTSGWTTGSALSYQWKRNGAVIPGATQGRYRLTPGDVNRAISVTVTGRLAGYEDASRTSAASKAVVAAALRTATPKITGTAVVGKKLQASAGTWTTGAKLTYQWKRNGTAIRGATKSSYTLVAADGGTRVTVAVTGSLAGYRNASTTSAAKSVLRLLAPVTPKIVGAAQVGSTVSAQTGSWKPVSPKFSYQWLRDGSAIRGATGASYRVASADAGKTLSVRVTGTKSGYQSATRTSAVKRVPKVLKAGNPRISGSATVGSKLSGSAGSWTAGTTLRYQWYRSGVAVPGATGTSYWVGAADVGHTITLYVAGSKSGYVSTARSTGPTRVVSYPSRTTPYGWDCPAWAPIKGNASSRIYHVPGGAYYSRTKPEECFATRWAAEQAGYRASMR